MELKLEIDDLRNLSSLLNNAPEDFPNKYSIIKSIVNQIRDNTCIRFPTGIEEIDLHIMSFVPDMDWRYVLLVNKLTLSLLNKDYLWRPKIESKFGYDFGLSLNHSYMNFYYRLSLTKKSLFNTAIDYSIVPLIKYIFVPDFYRDDYDDDSIVDNINENNIDIVTEIFIRNDDDEFDFLLNQKSIKNGYFYKIFDIISNKNDFIERSYHIIKGLIECEENDNVIKYLFLKYPVLKFVILSLSIHIKDLKEWTRSLIRDLNNEEMLLLCSREYLIEKDERIYLFKKYRKRDPEGARKLLEKEISTIYQEMNIMHYKYLGDLGKIKYIRKMIDKCSLRMKSTQMNLATIIGLMKKPKIYRLASLAKEKNLLLFFYEVLENNQKVIDYVSADCLDSYDRFDIMMHTINSENLIAGEIIFSNEWISLLDENLIHLFNRIKEGKKGTLTKYQILIFENCIRKNIHISIKMLKIMFEIIDTTDTTFCNILVKYLVNNWNLYKYKIQFDPFSKIAPKLRYIKWIADEDLNEILPLLFNNMSNFMISRSLSHIFEKINTFSNKRIDNIWKSISCLDFTSLDSDNSDILAKGIIDNHNSKSIYFGYNIISNLRPKFRYMKWVFDKGSECFIFIPEVAKNMKKYLLLRCDRLARSRGIINDFYIYLGNISKIILETFNNEELYKLLPKQKIFTSREKLLEACYLHYFLDDIDE